MVNTLVSSEGSQSRHADPANGPSPADIRAAAMYLKDKAIVTPVRRLEWLERLLGVPVWAKLECQQHTGSFKYRGAAFRLRNVRRSEHVIAASAGNHGLAVAEVCRGLGLRVDICLPTTASRLKRERILATGAGLVEVGSSLEDAVEHAKLLARQRSSTFISPYNDSDVIAANATIAREFCGQVSELESLVVPIGGGGLVAGMALGAGVNGQSLAIFGCEPERYSTMTSALGGQKPSSWVHQPTLADGLAVAIEGDSITIPLVRKHVSEIITLSEEELAAATLALLVHESILVEPAGAAGVAACLRLAQRGQLTGPVGIPLCGGNLNHSALVRIQRFPFLRPDLLRLLDLRGRQTRDQPVARSFLSGSRSTEQVARQMSLAPSPATRGYESDEAALHENCGLALDTAMKQLADLTQYAQAQDLDAEPRVLASMLELGKQVTDLFKKSRKEGSSEEVDDSTSRGFANGTLRWGLSTTAYLRSTLEWCSASYSQSRALQFFDLSSQDSPGVNYERYESAEVQRVESQLAEVFDIPTDELSVTVTSSGMAAYTLIESFLLRERLLSGSRVLVAPYIYFEAYEQLATIPGIECRKVADFSLETLLREIEDFQPQVILIDPLTNTADQRMFDVPEVLKYLRARCTTRTTLVIDGTMVSGSLRGEDLSSTAYVEVLYYESASKYLQLGMDASMAGCLVHPIELRNRFLRLRRNTGTILSRHGALLFPTYTASQFRRRMARVSANAVRICSLLRADERVTEVADVIHPGHPSHPDHQMALRYPYAGGCVTFTLRNVGFEHRDQLDALIERTLHRCREAGVHLTKGVSFGFDAPRISAAASMAETDPAFLRLYAGDREFEIDSLASALADSLADHLVV